eukprot:412683-Ditylum_brightwellii.AAC.2
MRRFKNLTKETLKESGGMNSGLLDKLRALKEWYLFGQPVWMLHLIVLKKFSPMYCGMSPCWKERKPNTRTQKKSERSKKKKKTI